MKHTPRPTNSTLILDRVDIKLLRQSGASRLCPYGPKLSHSFGSSSMSAVSCSIPRKMLLCHSRASLNLSITTTSMASSLSFRFVILAPRCWLTGGTTSPVPLRELAAPLSSDGGPPDRAFLPACDLGVPPADNFLLHWRPFSSGLTAP